MPMSAMWGWIERGVGLTALAGLLVWAWSDHPAAFLAARAHRRPRRLPREIKETGNPDPRKRDGGNTH